MKLQTMKNPPAPRRLLPIKEVMARVALSRSAIYALIKSQDFPRPVRLTPHRTAWPESEIDSWIDARTQATRSGSAALTPIQERDKLRALCAAVYQAAGAYDLPVRFLDALSDAANGEIELRRKTWSLLPCDSPPA